MRYANVASRELSLRKLTPAQSGVSLLLVILASCAAAPREPVGSVQESVVYGRDDRIEAYAAAEGPLKNAALHASAVLLEQDSVHFVGDGQIALANTTLAEVYGLCADEPFANQPSVGFCSGTLVAPDVLLTAGHCLALWSCSRLAIVFGYRYTEAGTLRELGERDVYRCAEVLRARVSDRDATERLDYGFIRLDRAVEAGLTPVTLNPTNALADGDAVAIVGHGAGLPAKIAAGAHVIDARADVRDYFGADLDDFEGGSGSGVFDAQGTLVGVAARGEIDFELAEEGCNRSRAGESAQAEQITYLARAIDGLCDDPALLAPCPSRGTHARAGCACIAPHSGFGSATTTWLALLIAFRVRESRRRSLRALNLRVRPPRPKQL
jgi:hypothetical protein